MNNENMCETLQESHETSEKHPFIESNSLKYGIVCIMDALGTKGVWRNEESNIYINNIKQLREDIRKLISHIKTFFKDKNIDTSFNMFSDTFFITLQTKIDTINEENTSSNLDYYFGLMSYLISEIYYSAIIKGIFIRGAISCGKFYTDGEMLIGPAIDDAASLYEISNLFSVICSPAATFKIREGISLIKNRKIDDPIGSFFIEHNVPIKNKFTNNEFNKKFIVIDWPRMFIERVSKAEENLYKESCVKGKPISRMSYIDYINMYFSLRPIPLEAMDKFENTIKFMEESYKGMSKHKEKKKY